MNETVETTHTPGPWSKFRIKAHPKVGLPPESLAFWGISGDKGTNRVSTVYDESPNAEANASLIAAAPELLEALESLHALFLVLDKEQRFVVGSSVWGLMNNAIEKARS